MSTSNAPKASRSASQRLSLRAVILTLRDQTRWKILEELASGEPRMVLELAEKVGQSAGSVSKHMQVLKALGVVKVTRRAYQLAEQFRPADGKNEIDLGHCVMRFGGGK